MKVNWRWKSKAHYRTVISLLNQAFIFRYHKIQAKSMKPAAISLALTQRCNSHCIMCNIWKRKIELPEIEKHEMSCQEIVELFSKSLFSGLVELDLTGGEPNLRSDLVEIVIGVAELKNSSLPKLRSIIITSNGLLPEKIFSNYQKILERMKGIKVDLVSVSSVDGIGEVHDKIRGTGKAFENVSRTIDGLLELRSQYTNFFPGIKTTILPNNINMLDRILKFASTRQMFHIISPVFITKSRFSNAEQKEHLILRDSEYRKISEFYRRNKLDMIYYYFQACRALESEKKQWTCTAAYDYFFIEFDGKVFPCELAAEPIGDLKQDSIENIWRNRAFRKWRKEKDNLSTCQKCLEPGAVRYSACSEGLSYLEFLRKKGRNAFLNSLNQEGLSKYIAVN